MRIVCSNCGSTKIQHKVWRMVNSGAVIKELINDKEDEDLWCPNCDRNVSFITEEEWNLHEE